jgi:lysophospholipase L1-like esterase
MSKTKQVRPVARTFVVLALAALTVAAATVGNGSAAGGPPGSGTPHWVGTWGASPQQEGVHWFVDQTLRQVVRISVGGDTLRVRFSNLYGTKPLVIGAASIGLSAGNAAVRPGTSRVLAFGGSSSIIVPPGAPALSDPVVLHAPPLTDMVISLWLPDSTAATTAHATAMATTFVSTAGNHTEETTLPTDTTSRSWYFLTGVSVTAPEDAAAVVTLGNSITDGWGSTVDANARWPNVLAARLQARPDLAHVAVLDEGISGNRLLHHEAGPNALSRFDRDVLAQPGVRWVVVLEGINDIGWSLLKGHATEGVSAAEIIRAHRQLIARAHQAGLKIYGATLTPFEGAGYATPEGEAKREAVNRWIRTSGEYDGVIDFDEAVRDPVHPERFLPPYDSGDHLHPSDAGYKAMGDAIDLRLFEDGPRVGAKPDR